VECRCLNEWQNKKEVDGIAGVVLVKYEECLCCMEGIVYKNKCDVCGARYGKKK
jgi:hypothetical protein